MYKWYYGTDKYPTDKRNAIIEIVLSIGGCVAVYVAWLVVFYMKGMV